MKRLLYIGEIGYPETAMYAHTRNMAELFSQMGECEIQFLCWGYPDGRQMPQMQEGYVYRSTGQFLKAPVLKSLERVAEECFGMKIWKAFQKAAAEFQPDTVIIYGYDAERKIVNYCKNHGITVILERVDWFERDHYANPLYRILVYPVWEYYRKHFDRRADGIITISNYLQAFYSAQGANTIRIPPVVSQNWENRELKRHDTVVRLVYAGSLDGDKDLILPVVEALLRINEDKVRIRLDLVGITEEQISRRMEEYDWKSLGIICHGRKDHEATLAIVERADFGILLRQNKRYAKAGFSTKFAECMSLGVAMICTQVGGADDLIDSNENGILLPDNEAETVYQALMSLLELSDEKLLSMKTKAYDTAYSHFRPGVYFEEMKDFLAIAEEKAMQIGD